MILQYLNDNLEKKKIPCGKIFMSFLNVKSEFFFTLKKAIFKKEMKCLFFVYFRVCGGGVFTCEGCVQRNTCFFLFTFCALLPVFPRTGNGITDETYLID